MTELDFSITVKELYNAFTNNRTKAEKKCLNRIITVKGIVVYAGPDMYSLPSLELAEKIGETSHVLCVLPILDYPKILKGTKGEEAVIRGQVHVFHNNTTIVMKKCKILKRTPIE